MVLVTLSYISSSSNVSNCTITNVFITSLLSLNQAVFTFKRKSNLRKNDLMISTYDFCHKIVIFTSIISKIVIYSMNEHLWWCNKQHSVRHIYITIHWCKAILTHILLYAVDKYSNSFLEKKREVFVLRLWSDVLIYK